MASDGAVIYTIQGDNSQFNADLNKSKTLATASAVAIGTAFVDMSKRVASAISSAISMGMDYNAQMETYQTSFETMLGSAEKAADLMEQIKQKAASTPFETEDLTAVTQLLMNYGLTAEDAIDKMNMLGDISQGNADKMMRIATAYGQMSSAGRVTLEDINQMIEAGFSPLQEISESTGESIASLRNRISEGTLAVDEITESMKRSTSQGGKYFQAMDKQSKTLSGQMSTLKDNTNSFLGALTSGIFNVTKNNVLPKLNSEMEKLTKSAQSGSLKKSIDKMTDSFEDLADEAIDFAMDIIPDLINSLSWVMDNFDTLVGVAKTAVTTFLTFKTLDTIMTPIEKMVKGFQNAQVSLSLFTLENGKAALSNAALTTQLSASEIITGLLTGKITLATAAQTLWNAAMSANPIGVIIIAITTLTAGITALTVAFNNSNNKFKRFSETIEEDAEKLDELKESAKQTKKEFENNEKTIETNAVLAEKLTKRLAELEKQTDKSVSTKQEMSEIVSQLNEIYPDLNLQYNEETDALNMNTDAIFGNIDALKAQYLLNNDIEERQSLWEKEKELQDSLAEAQAHLTEVQKEYNDTLEENAAQGEYLGAGDTQRIANTQALAQALEDAKNNVAGFQSELEANAAAQDEINASIDSQKEHIDGLAGSTGELANAEQQVVIGGYDMTEALASSGISAEEAQEKFDTYAESTQNAFERIKDNVTLTADEMINNLNANQTRISEWTTNLGILADRGLDSGLLQALRELGPEAAVTVENLANTSSDKLQLLNDAYARGGDMAANALLTELGLPEVTGAGGATIEAVADSMVNGTDSTQEAARTVVHDIRSTLNETVENTSFSSVGYSICTGVAKGIESGESVVKRKARLMAKAAYNAAKDELDIHSPSKVFDKLARFIPQGVAKGIETDTPKAEKATKNMSQKLISSAGLSMPVFAHNSYTSLNTAASTNPQFNISLKGSVDVDGIQLGTIMLRNLDDAAAFTLRG